MNQNLYNYSTKLNDKILFYDGSVELEPNKLYDYIFENRNLKNVYVKHITDDIKKYNSIVDENERIDIKKEINLKKLDIDFNIPQKYKNLNVFEYIENKFLNSIEDDWDDEEIKNRFERLIEEYKLFKNNGLEDVLKLLIYIIDMMKENNVVWGVGRGSSVSSYILYILEVHDIDSYLYDLDITEFIK